VTLPLVVAIGRGEVMALAPFAQQVLAEPGFEFEVRGGDGMVGWLA